ncbi:hypothetical protein SGPA1_10921 [Streptomyces misionensis JCM 4497]
MATAVRLGRYLDVEITLVHRCRMVMPGRGADPCPPCRARGRNCGFHHGPVPAALMGWADAQSHATPPGPRRAAAHAHGVRVRTRGRPRRRRARVRDPRHRPAGGGRPDHLAHPPLRHARPHPLRPVPGAPRPARRHR